MKCRLDSALVERGLAASRTIAQSLVMEGKVRVNGQVAAKSAVQIHDSDKICFHEMREVVYSQLNKEVRAMLCK